MGLRTLRACAVTALLASAVAPLTARGVIRRTFQNQADSRTAKVARRDPRSAIVRLLLSTHWVGGFALLAEAASQDQPPRDLFVPAPTALAAPDGGSDPTVMRARRVTVNSAMLPDAANEAPGRGASLRLNLFDDVVLAASLDRLDRTAGGFVWVGHVDGMAMSSVTLSSHEGVIGGMVFLANGVYRVRFVGEHIYEIAQIDQSKFPREALPREEPSRGGRGAIPPPPKQ